MTLLGRESIATSEVFRHYADRVVKIQVVETGSAANATIGSGVFVAATVIGVVALSALSKDDSFSDEPKYTASLKPVAPGLVPTKSIAQFESVTKELKDDVDQLAKK